jgi:hypothetical protein
MTSYAGNIGRMESFSVSTDGSGRGVITLAATPVADGAILCWAQTSRRVCSFISRTTTAVTLEFYKLMYDKTNSPITGALSNLPASVSEWAAKSNTDSYSATGQSLTSGDYCAPTHSHGISGIYRHDHTPTYTSTNVALATSETIVVTVIYSV